MEVRCKTCDVGELRSKRTYRLSAVVVAIGYILLIPSVLGILFSFYLYVQNASALNIAKNTVRSSARTEAVEKLRKAGIADALVLKALAPEGLTVEEKRLLTPEQRTSIEQVASDAVTSERNLGLAGTVVSGVALLLGTVSFVGGLFGWVLVMKKSVLQCTACSAVVAAS
jgi:hypothetical protein